MGYKTSKIVYVKRAQAFIHENINSPQMQENLRYSKRSIGACFKSKASKLCRTGLSDSEVEILLPVVLGKPANHIEFAKDVDIWYANISTSVPFSGKTLEIGLRKSNEEPVAKDNMPINVEEYLAYRHIVGGTVMENDVVLEIPPHPQCARTPEEALGDSTVKYYIEDPLKEVEKEYDILKIKDDAADAYRQAKGDMKKVKMIVNLMIGKVNVKNVKRLNFDANKALDKENLLIFKELSEKEPKGFAALCNDQNIARKYFVNELISKNILNRNGTIIVDAETRTPLGASLLEVANKLHDAANIAMLNNYKIALERKSGLKMEEILLD